MRKELFLVFLLFFIFPANAGFNVVQPYVAIPSEINLTKDYNSINNQILYLFPSAVLQQVSYIDAYSFYCGKDSAGTTGNYNVRFYTYNPNEIVFINRFTLIDNVNIPASSCTDWAYRITVNLQSNLDVSSFSANNNSVAIGIFSTTTTGTHYTFGSPNFVGFFNPALSTTYGSVSSIANTAVYFNGGSTAQIKSMTYGLYGQYKIPPTALPPPLPTSTVIATIPDIGNGTLPTFEGGNDSIFTPDFTNLTDCPDCLGNETTKQDGLSTTNSSIGTTMNSLGYCKGGSCNIYDFFDLLYDLGWALFLVSVVWILYKFIYLEYWS